MDLSLKGVLLTSLIYHLFFLIFSADKSTVSLASSDNHSPYQMHLSPEEVSSGVSTLASTNPFVIDINSDDLVHETSPASNGVSTKKSIAHSNGESTLTIINNSYCELKC